MNLWRDRAELSANTNTLQPANSIESIPAHFSSLLLSEYIQQAFHWDKVELEMEEAMF